jgi:hypothetical protein
MISTAKRAGVGVGPVQRIKMSHAELQALVQTRWSLLNGQTQRGIYSSVSKLTCHCAGLIRSVTQGRYGPAVPSDFLAPLRAEVAGSKTRTAPISGVLAVCMAARHVHRHKDPEIGPLADIRLSQAGLGGVIKMSEVKGSGFIGSLALHGLVVALVVLSSENRTPPPRVRIVAVNLVQLSDKSMSPLSPKTAPVPQDKASTTPQSEAVQAALAPIAAPQPDPLTPSAPNSGATAKPREGPNSPRTVVMPVSPSTNEIARAPRLSPNEQPAERPKSLADAPQRMRPMSNNARQQDGTGMSNMTVTSPDALPGLYATYAVRDFNRDRPKKDSRATYRHSPRTRNSTTTVEAWPPKWQSKYSHEYSPKGRRLQWQTPLANGSRQVAEIPSAAATPHTASDPAVGLSSSQVSSSGTSSAGNGNGGISDSSSSSSGSKGNSSLGGLGGLASVGHALGGALAGVAGGGRGGHGGK